MKLKQSLASLLILGLLLPLLPFSTASAASSCTSLGLSRSLKLGSSGSDVTTLSKVLGITPTNTFNAQLKTAVIAFQKEANITTDGITGPGTYAALSSKCLTFLSPNAVVPAVSPVSSTFTFKNNMSLGSKSSDVLQLQKVLNLNAETRVALTGTGSLGKESTTFGPATRAAVMKFQKKYGVSPVNGNVGPLTRAKLNSVIALSANPAGAIVTKITDTKYEINGLTNLAGDLKPAYLGVGGGGGGSSAAASSSSSTTTTTTGGGGGGSSTTTTTGGGGGGGGGGTSTTTTGGTTSPSNSNPVGVNDTGTNGLSPSATGNLLTNDTDADNDTLSVTDFVVASSTFSVATDIVLDGIGTINIQGNGDYTFVPLQNYYGSVPVITYHISDGHSGTATATLTLSITPANNHNPVGVDDSNTVSENGTVSGNVLSNDTDTDGDTLSVSAFVVSGATTAAGITKTINGVGSLVINSNGVYSFTPATDYIGSVPVATYTISDGHNGTATATLTIVIGEEDTDPDALTAGQFAFTLSGNARTSAGIYDSNSVLVRTLWSGVTYTAGRHVEYWDGKNDAGTLIATSSSVYTVKVLENNVSYTWQGVIGNTSDLATGSTHIRSFVRVRSMAVNGNTGYYAAGYAESDTSSRRLDFRTPQAKVDIMNTGGTNQQSDYVATDGTYVYWAGFDPVGGNASFTYATKVSDDTEVTSFSSGSSIGTAWGRTYPKAIDINTSGGISNPTGLAVQRTGNYLLIAHGGLNELHVLNKTTGALVQTLTYTNPRELAIDGSDNLWMVTGTNTVAKYTVNGNGTLTSATVTLSGLVDPLALGVSYDNTLVAVVDGGSSQQVKAFSNTTGNTSWTLGQAGGYTTDPLVTNDKFYFSDTYTQVKDRGTFIAFQTDGSFWVGDSGNERLQHYAASRTFIDRIMSLPASYSVYADQNDPTRVFNEYLEFKIDYSKGLAANNGSWVLYKNWRHGIDANHYQDFKAEIFREVTTLSNGRTYAILNDSRAWPTGQTKDWVELPATGNLRFTGQRTASFSRFSMDKDGNTYEIFYPNGTDVGATGINWKKSTLTGFDGNNNPIWSAPTTIATLPTVTASDPIYSGGDYAPKTSSDVLVVFNTGRDSAGYHLGGIKVGDNKWLWKTAPATFTAYNGPFPDDGAFDIGNGVVYPGGHAYALEKNIFWNYHGEFWKQGQTNIWNQVYDNGLFIGQFGKIQSEAIALYGENPAEYAGNTFSATVVKVGSDYYLYYNQEGPRGVVDRWKISGLDTILEHSTTVTGYGTKVLPGTNLMAGLPFRTTLANNTNGWTRNPTTNLTGTTTWSVTTNAETYKKDQTDVKMNFSGPNGTAYVARSIGTINGSLTNWKVTGNINYSYNTPQWDNFGGGYFDILDDQGKIISRVTNDYTYGNPNVKYIKINGTTVLSGSDALVTSVISKQQPFQIATDSSGVTFTYGTYTPVHVNLYDSAAHWNKPTTINFNFYGGASNYERHVSVDSLRYTEN